MVAIRGGVSDGSRLAIYQILSINSIIASDTLRVARVSL